MDKLTHGLQGFTTASGVAYHLESASCPRARNANRETIYKLVNARDTSGVITNKLLTWDNGSNADYVATNASWNGYYFECYLCHHQFTSLIGLNRHLSSPTHKQKLYHCFVSRCGKQFSALAPLFNHLESESCGAVRFGQVQRVATGIMTGQKKIAF
jgi:hypothetical protein